MRNSKRKNIRLSDRVVNFISEYVFKPLQTTFYMDEKILDAVYDLSLCCSEFLNPACSSSDMQIGMQEAKIGKAVYKELSKIEECDSVDFADLNARLNLQPQPQNDGVDIKYVKLRTYICDKIDPQNEIIWEKNRNKRFIEMAKNLQETIDYLDSCSENELWCATEVLEELSEHFKSQALIDCVERNIARFDNPELQEQIKTELDYMKAYLP